MWLKILNMEIKTLYFVTQNCFPIGLEPKRLLLYSTCNKGKNTKTNGSK
jgi:hypothetical protein